MPIKIERIDYTNLSIPERLVLIQDILDSVVEALPEQHEQSMNSNSVGHIESSPPDSHTTHASAA